MGFGGPPRKTLHTSSVVSCTWMEVMYEKTESVTTMMQMWTSSRGCSAAYLMARI